MCKKLLLLSLLSVFVFLSCKEDKQKREAVRIVKEWSGKEIKFPSSLICGYMGRDTTSYVCSDLLNREYKVLLYVDSTGCTDCKLQLSAWKNIINEVRGDDFLTQHLSFLFFFNPKDRNKKELYSLLKRDKFDYPIFMDVENEIDRLNNFSEKSQYQCFLLDKYNRVVMIGNPTFNPRIWDMYKEQISGTNTLQNKIQTSVKFDKAHHDYGEIFIGEAQEAIFEIVNTGYSPLVITQVNSSCGCTSVEWPKEPIAEGGVAKVKVLMKPDELGFFNKTINVYCNIDEMMIRLAISGTAVE